MPRLLAEGKMSAVSDAFPGNVVDRYAPSFLLPYLRLARFDRPAGFWLLAMPCFWAVALASRTLGAEYPDPTLLLLFAIGALVMRGAGCTYNDIIDKDIDAKVARTQTRPLPSGQVSVKAATIFMVGLSLIGLLVLLSFNATTIWLGLLVLPMVAAYPLVKRVSSWPQAVLGLAFNWGALLGYTAVLGRLEWAAVILYGGAIAWTIGYDTIYAHQDRDDDALLGLKSTALKFGANTKIWLVCLLRACLGRHHACGLVCRRRDRLPARHGRGRRPAFLAGGDARYRRCGELPEALSLQSRFWLHRLRRARGRYVSRLEILRRSKKQ